MNISEKNAAQIYIESLPSLGSRRTMKNRLNVIARFLTGVEDAYLIDWGAMTYAHSAQIRGYVTQHFADRTINTMLSAYRGVLKTAWRIGQLDTDTYHRAVDVQNVPKQPSEAGRFIEPEEISKLFATCEQDTTLFGLRDFAVLHILRNGGLRRSEISDLEVRDFDAADRSVFIRNAKGRKQRYVFLPRSTTRAIERWLERYTPNDPHKPLFSRISQGDIILGRPITDQSIYNLVLKRTQEAGIPPLSTHDFRRTYISGLFDKGVDISTISQLAGHDRTDGTAAYDRRKDAPKRRAADLLDE